MNQKQKETSKTLVSDLRKVVPAEDRPKLEQLTRIIGELRRERGQLSTRVAELASQRDARHAAAAKADSETEKRIAAMEQRFAQTESKLRQQLAERKDMFANLAGHTFELRDGLYPIETGPLFIAKAQLIRANDDSIRLGYNRNIKEDYLATLPDQDYLIMRAFYHIGFSGREFQQMNYRLMLALCSKRASRFITNADMEHAILDVSAELWSELRTQAIEAQTAE